MFSVMLLKTLDFYPSPLFVKALIFECLRAKASGKLDLSLSREGKILICRDERINIWSDMSSSRTCQSRRICISSKTKRGYHMENLKQLMPTVGGKSERHPSPQLKCGK